MPIYIFEHPESKERKEIVQGINDVHEYKDETGTRWNRIFCLPELNITEKLDASSSEKDFSNYASKRKGTLGDLWDKSRELSEKRERVFGRDPVKEKYKKNWSKKRKNRRYID